MALTMWGQVIIQAATPGEDPVQVGTLWVDTTTTPSVKTCTAISPYTFAALSSGVSDGDKGDITVSGSGATWTIDAGAVTEAKQTLADNTTNDVSITKHGYAPKAPNDATTFLDGTGAYDTVKDSDLSTTDVTTNDASTTKHGFAPKATAPAAGLLSVLAIGNGATVRSDTAIFDTTAPAALGTAAAGTALVAARRDHVHAFPRPTIQNTTLTGAQNNFSLSAGFTALICANASALTISGASVGGSAPVAGDILVIHNEGSSTVKVTLEDTGSTDVHRFDTPSAAGQIIGTDGTMSFVYEGGSANRWHLTSVEPGNWINVAYASGNFTGSGSMTVTVEEVDQQTFKYRQQGRVLMLSLQLEDFTVGGTPSITVQIAMPGGFTIDGNQQNTILLLDNTVDRIGRFGNLDSQNTILRAQRQDGANWTASTNLSSIRASGLWISID